MAWTLPRSLRQKNAAERAVAARVELARERERAQALRERAAAIRANRADLERFYTTLAGDEKQDLLPTLDGDRGAGPAPEACSRPRGRCGARTWTRRRSSAWR